MYVTHVAMRLRQLFVVNAEKVVQLKYLGKNAKGAIVTYVFIVDMGTIICVNHVKKDLILKELFK
jgi:hypothetical protein